MKDKKDQRKDCEEFTSQQNIKNMFLLINQFEEIRKQENRGTGKQRDGLEFDKTLVDNMRHIL